MARNLIDYDGLARDDIVKLRNAETPDDLPFTLSKISHVVLKTADLERSVKFYTEVLGMRVSDAYPESMMPGRMVFLRCANGDHHGIALVGGKEGPADNSELHHFAFEVDTIDEVFCARNHLRKLGIPISFEGRRRAGQQVAIEFSDPDNHQLEICWCIDRVGPHEKSRAPEEWKECLRLEDAVANPPKGQDTTLQDRSLLKDR
jgi:catechol 2,3-dioxygenase-like lactoylglutathione lyase family enzyme